MDKKKIMAIDDNAVNLGAIEKALQDEYDVIPMAAGKRAIRYLQGRQVDLILLDVQMPEMDGVTALREIRGLENGRGVPVFFLTATLDEGAAREGKELGVLDCILKPIDGDALKEKIAGAL